jgi:hypothetical protein
MEKINNKFTDSRDLSHLKSLTPKKKHCDQFRHAVVVAMMTVQIFCNRFLRKLISGEFEL